jgi:PAS domain-containing protein
MAEQPSWSGYEFRRCRIAANSKAASRHHSTYTLLVYASGPTISTSPNSFKQPTDQTARPTAPAAHLHALPAPVLLDRLPIPMLGTGLDGVVVYTNPAFATLLGHHPDTITLTGKRLPELLAGHSATSPGDCVTDLRTARNVVVDWLHAEGFPVRTVISETLCKRGADQILLIGLTDITDLIWSNPPKSP